MQGRLERLRQRRETLGEKEGGFTLIELLIVIVILGILAAIVVFAVQNLTSQSKTAACNAQVKTAETAIEAYKAQIGAYPTGTGADAAAISASIVSQLETTKTGLDGQLDGPWLKDALPTGTQPYLVTYDNSGNVNVQTIAANGAKSDHAAAPGVANCAFA